jgi:hypothetical protein
MLLRLQEALRAIEGGEIEATADGRARSYSFEGFAILLAGEGAR